MNNRLVFLSIWLFLNENRIVVLLLKNNIHNKLFLYKREKVVGLYILF